TSVVSGAATSYTIVVSDAGPDAANGAVVTDPAVAGLAKTAVSCAGESGGAACPASPTVAQLEGGLAIPTLPAGSSVTFTVTANVTAGVGASVTNTATVAVPAGSADPDATNNQASDTDTVIAPPEPDLAVAKSHAGNFAQGESGATYTLTVSNAGTASTAGSVTLVDALPGGLAATAISGTGWTCTLAALTCTRSDALAAGASYPAVTLTVDVDAAAPASVTNTATVSGGGESNLANDTASDPTTIDAVVVPQADVGVTKTNGVSGLTAGASTSYTIVVTNAGPDAADGALLADAAAAGLSKTSVSCGGATGGAACPASPTVAQLEAGIAIPALPAGSSVTFTVNADVTAAGGANVSNTASVAPPGGTTDANAANDSATDTDPVAAAPAVANLVVTKTDGVAGVTAGATTTYTIVVSNAGPDAADGATLADAAAAGLAKTAVACGGATGGAVCPGSPSVAQLEAGIAIPTLPAGSSVTFTVTADVTASAGANVSNTAVAAPPAGTSDPNPADDQATDTDAVSAATAPDLAIAKSHVGNFTQGQSGAAYAITVTNMGTGATTGAVTVTDALPAGLTASAASGAGWTCTIAPLACTRADVLAAGASYPAITLTVDVDAAAAASVTNTASVATAGDGNATNDTASDPTTIVATADLAIAKSHAGNFTRGQAGATYSLVVTNVGLGPSAGNVTVTDVLPAGLAATAISGAGWTCILGSLACTRADVLAAGASYPAITLTVDVDAAAPASVVNSATVSGGGDANAANNAAIDPTLIDAPPVPQADLAVTKDDGAASVVAGGSTSYTIVVANNGPDAADGAILRDPAAAGLAKTGASCIASSGGAACPAGLSVAALEAGIAIATLPAGSTVTVRVDANATAVAGASVTNSVQVLAPGGVNDANAANDAASDTDAVIAPAVANGAITGHVWYDRDGNRRYDGGEVGRAGWRVELWSGASLVATTMSAADGAYGFTGLPVGAYTVRFSSPNPGAGPMPVNGENGVPVSGGGTPARCELANVVLAASGGGVASVAEQSLPVDPSGVVYDSVTRQPIAGATVTLLHGGSPVDPAFVAGASATVTTTPSGGYAFFLLPAAPAGTYSLRVDAAGYRFTSAIVPPSAAPPGFAGGAVTAIAGAPAAGQDTTYYVQFPRPAIDITHDNLPVDPASVGLAPRAVPMLSQWALLLLALAVAALGARGARRP
ncbi:MAG TPA: IPTL-CTERM sorting domain-containing protein, partial [Usitatibacter sp.]